MEIKFKILEIDQSQHSILVRYFTDYFTEDNLASSFTTDQSGQTIIDRNLDGSPKRCQTDYNINIWKTNPSPTLEDIKKLANDAAPYEWFKLKHDVLDPAVDTSLSNANALIGQIFTYERTTQMTEDDLQKLIDSITTT